MSRGGSGGGATWPTYDRLLRCTTVRQVYDDKPRRRRDSSGPHAYAGGIKSISERKIAASRNLAGVFLHPRSPKRVLSVNVQRSLYPVGTPASKKNADDAAAVRLRGAVIFLSLMLLSPLLHSERVVTRRRTPPNSFTVVMAQDIAAGGLA